MEDEFNIDDLTGDELINLYNVINDFIEFLDKEVEETEKVGEQDDK